MACMWSEEKRFKIYINFSLRGICAFHSYTHCKCQYFFHFWLIVSFLEWCGGTI